MRDTATPTSAALRGLFLDGTSAASHEADAWLDGAALVVRVGDAQTRVALADVRVEPPLGRLRRVLHLPGGARFETDDDAGVRALLSRAGAREPLRLVRTLEGRLGWVLASLVAFVAAGVLMVTFGLPALSGVAARLTPHTALSSMDAQVLRVLDRQYLAPSTLSGAQRSRVERVFGRVTREVGEGQGFRFRLVTREGGETGANAMALPGGTVVVTDELVRAARSDAELAGVFAHEAGHVTLRHGAASAYRSVGLLLFVSLLTGDVSSATTAASALPLLLVQNGYSREMERDADRVAAGWLMRHGGSTRPLRDILTRLDEERPSVPDLLSTHPGLEERLSDLRVLEANWGR
ncbi:M48 family metallopeptidase [Deinococcus pimensis]|uniref:M48 family metallopeptidase n=1 Tax=Deinococcus pimensis TaxID=309888 RepID=UPI0004B6D75A|nr:M48 family metallopeptidase [Deinococcus pimensis]